MTGLPYPAPQPPLPQPSLPWPAPALPPQRPARSEPRFGWLPSALLAVVALIGLLGTLLPVWVVHIDLGDLQVTPPPSAQVPGGRIDITVGFYDLLATRASAVALIPLALAVALAVAVLHLAGGPGHRAWGPTAALMVVTVTLTVATMIRPLPTGEVTGRLAEELRPGEVEQLTSGGDVPLDYGAGAVTTALAVLAVLGIAAWQYFATAAAARR